MKHYFNIILFTVALISCAKADTIQQLYVDGSQLPNKTQFVEADLSGMFPMVGSVGRGVTVLKITNNPQVSFDNQLTAISLQGLVNRDQARIFLYTPGIKDLYTLYKQRGVFGSESSVPNTWQLMLRFKEYCKAFVVYDPDKDYTVNLATNIAGVQNRVMITPDMIGKVNILNKGAADVLDIRTLPFYRIGTETAAEREAAFDWYMENIFPHQNHTVACLGTNSWMYNVFRDYPIAFKLPMFWLAGIRDSDYSLNLQNKVLDMLSHLPDNIPVLGFWPGNNKNGTSVGYEEFKGVKLAGEYAKFTVVNTWVGNYTFHSALHKKDSQWTQSLVRSKPLPKYDPSKKYVALVMTESGDAIGYIQSGLRARQWDDPYRGQVPVSYGICPAAQFLMPAYMDYIYSTATENDYFFCSISGAGYCYPFEGYADKRDDKTSVMRSYFAKTDELIKKMDIDIVALYTHSGGKGSALSDADSKILNIAASSMPGVHSIALGMHKIGDFNASNGNWLIDGTSTTAHYTMTHWTSDDTDPLNPGDTSVDDATAQYLASQIRSAAASGGNFIQAMFYSWRYIPRRLVLTKNILEKEGYVFVTLDQLDRLYRQTLQ